MPLPRDNICCGYTNDTIHAPATVGILFTAPSIRPTLKALRQAGQRARQAANQPVSASTDPPLNRRLTSQRKRRKRSGYRRCLHRPVENHCMPPSLFFYGCFFSWDFLLGFFYVSFFFIRRKKNRKYKFILFILKF